MHPSKRRRAARFAVHLCHTHGSCLPSPSAAAVGLVGAAWFARRRRRQQSGAGLEQGQQWDTRSGKSSNTKLSFDSAPPVRGSAGAGLGCSGRCLLFGQAMHVLL